MNLNNLMRKGSNNTNNCISEPTRQFEKEDFQQYAFSQDHRTVSSVYFEGNIKVAKTTPMQTRSTAIGRSAMEKLEHTAQEGTLNLGRVQLDFLPTTLLAPLVWVTIRVDSIVRRRSTGLLSGLDISAYNTTTI